MNSFFSTPVQQFTHKKHPASEENNDINAIQSSSYNKSLTPSISLEKRSSSISASEKDYKVFEILYNYHAPKIFGFLILHTKTKEQAEKYLMDIFLHVWNDIKNFNVDAEKKINKIVLVICRPLFKKHKI